MEKKPDVGVQLMKAGGSMIVAGCALMLLIPMVIMVFIVLFSMF